MSDDTKLPLPDLEKNEMPSSLDAAGHEVAYHGWCHEQWAELGSGEEVEVLQRGVDALGGLGLAARAARRRRCACPGRDAGRQPGGRAPSLSAQR